MKHSWLITWALLLATAAKEVPDEAKFAAEADKAVQDAVAEARQEEEEEKAIEMSVALELSSPFASQQKPAAVRRASLRGSAEVPQQVGSHLVVRGTRSDALDRLKKFVAGKLKDRSEARHKAKRQQTAEDQQQTVREKATAAAKLEATRKQLTRKQAQQAKSQDMEVKQETDALGRIRARLNKLKAQEAALTKKAQEEKREAQKKLLKAQAEAGAERKAAEDIRYKAKTMKMRERARERALQRFLRMKRQAALRLKHQREAAEQEAERKRHVGQAAVATPQTALDARVAKAVDAQIRQKERHWSKTQEERIRKKLEAQLKAKIMAKLASRDESSERPSQQNSAADLLRPAVQKRRSHLSNEAKARLKEAIAKSVQKKAAKELMARGASARINAMMSMKKHLSKSKQDNDDSEDDSEDAEDTEQSENFDAQDEAEQEDEESLDGDVADVDPLEQDMNEDADEENSMEVDDPEAFFQKAKARAPILFSTEDVDLRPFLAQERSHGKSCQELCKYDTGVRRHSKCVAECRSYADSGGNLDALELLIDK